jgi:hypothetical protein
VTIARRIAAIAAASLVMLGVVGCSASSADPGAARVSDRRYARTVCVTLDRLRTREATVATAHSALDVSEPSAFQRKSVDLFEGYAARLRRARAALSDIQPASGGDASRAFDRYLSTALRRLDAATDTFRAADSTSPEFQADVSTFEANLQFLAHELPDPFARIDDQALLAAFRDEPSCAGLVSIGGS